MKKIYDIDLPLFLGSSGKIQIFNENEHCLHYAKRLIYAVVFETENETELRKKQEIKHCCLKKCK